MTAQEVPYKYIKPSVIIELGALLMHDMKSPTDCHGDLRMTKLSTRATHIDSGFYLRWLANHGVTCDCDVIAGVALPLYEHVHFSAEEPWFLNDMFLPEKNIH